MPFYIGQREREGVILLDLQGRLTVGEGNSTLRNTVSELVERSQHHLVLNLREVEFIDSSGLGGLVICHTQVSKSGGHLKLLHLSKRNVELLVLTKLETVFETFDDEQDAINSFFPGREVKRFDILEFVRSQRDDGQ